jgi:hypothetical protein
MILVRGDALRIAAMHRSLRRATLETGLRIFTVAACGKPCAKTWDNLAVVFPGQRFCVKCAIRGGRAQASQSPGQIQACVRIAHWPFTEI